MLLCCHVQFSTSLHGFPQGPIMATVTNTFENVKAAVLLAHKNSSTADKIGFYNNWAKNYERVRQVLRETFLCPSFSNKNKTKHEVVTTKEPMSFILPHIRRGLPVCVAHWLLLKLLSAQFSKGLGRVGVPRTQFGSEHNLVPFPRCPTDSCRLGCDLRHWTYGQTGKYGVSGRWLSRCSDPVCIQSQF